ncbi:WD40 repeat-like protein [Coprinopsis marcescibilis]|uniref:WD40 repeat-like protein n=1 Tax=Coprinopsis marcescibilis TaxID=230819 RepID=A0A5C3L1Z8_COPMA|nr:WD40 repeat-like protein [Coprinopsis marcescibilis]
MDRQRRQQAQPDTTDLLRVLLALQSGAARPAGYGNQQTIDLSGIGLETLALLGARGLSWDDDDVDDVDDEDYVPEDDDDRYEYSGYTGRRSIPCDPPVVSEPKQKGLDLLRSGEFGDVRSHHTKQNNLSAQSLSSRLLKPTNRPLAYLPSRRERLAGLVPNTNGTTVATYDSNMYTAQFSDDSSFYYTCAQDFKLHIFDMTKTLHGFKGTGHRGSSLKTSMPLLKEIKGSVGRWTITDANLSPDNSRIIYSSIISTVYMTSTSPDGSSQMIPICFDDPRRNDSYYGERFGIWSCRFSADGNEVVAGGDGKIFVYDLIGDKRTVKIDAHDDDVNSCCWADTGSGNVLVSASDDSYLKVWDRRSLASKKPSGVLMGHTEGITYVSAKGDGRYVISNGKDQSLRLWDLRQMRSNQDLEAEEGSFYGIRGFDYRNMHYPRSRRAHPRDCSVMTYGGHKVLRTLIRCHFSPAATTGQQYIYSGSADGKVHIWSLDGRIVQVLDRSKTLPSSFSPSEPEHQELNGRPEHYCVRDVSWHSQEPVLMSAGWDAMYGGTAIARHEWKSLSKLRGNLEDWVEKEGQEFNETSQRRSHQMQGPPYGHSAQRQMPGAYDELDEPTSDYEDEDD